MNIAYIRVSTMDQNTQRQREALASYGIEKWFEEKISGKNTDRPQLKAMLDFVREGDTVFVHDLSRLARNTRDLLNLMYSLEQKSVTLVSVKENVDTSTAAGRLYIHMTSIIAEFERDNMLERQREGIAVAKRAGKYKGGKEKQVDRVLFAALLEQYQTRKISKREMAERLGISRPTLDKLIKEQESPEE